MASIAAERSARLAATPLTVIDARSGHGIRAFTSAVTSIASHSDLLVLLVKRQLKARYKDSVLGLFWSLIKPLTMLLIYYIALGQFMGAARGIADFAIFIFSGLTIWGLYAEIVSTGSTSIVENAALIKKVRVPRELFPLAAVGSALVNFGFQFVVLIAAVLILGVFPISWALLYVPAAMIVVLLFGIALALLMSALNVYLRDMQYLVEVIMMVFFWASPIVYAWSFVVSAADRLHHQWIEWVYLMNPVTIAVMAFQRGIWKSGNEYRIVSNGPGNPVTTLYPQPWPDLTLYLAIAAFVGLVFVYVSQRVFDRLQGNFAQEI